jgi:hypothetical protein
VSPENPAAGAIDSEGRIRVGRARVPPWILGDSPSYLVPLLWRRELDIPQGHELEAWTVWNEAISDSSWVVSPRKLLVTDSNDPGDYQLRSLIFEVRYDTKERLCCAGLFASLAKVAGRVVWVAPEKDSVSIWSNFAFQATQGRRQD